MFDRQLVIQILDIEIKRLDSILALAGRLTIGLDADSQETITIVYQELRNDVVAKRAKAVEALRLEERRAEQEIDLMRGK